MRIVLTTATPVGVNGKYTVRFDMSSGTAKLQTKSASGSFVDIDSTSKSASSSFNVCLSGEVQAVLTGDATAEIERINE